MFLTNVNEDAGPPSPAPTVGRTQAPAQDSERQTTGVSSV